MAPSEILPGLFLGDAQDAIAWAPTVGLAQKHAVVCVLEGCPLNIAAPPYHFHIHLLGTAPDNKISPASLDAVSAILQYFRNEQWTVLIHCGAGIERSPLAVAWYLHSGIHPDWLVAAGGVDKDTAWSFVTSDNLNEAYKFIMGKRPQVQDRQAWIAPE